MLGVIHLAIHEKPQPTHHYKTHKIYHHIGNNTEDFQYEQYMLVETNKNAGYCRTQWKSCLFVRKSYC